MSGLIDDSINNQPDQGEINFFPWGHSKNARHSSLEGSTRLHFCFLNSDFNAFEKNVFKGAKLSCKRHFFYFIKVQSLHGYVLKSYYLDKQNVTQGFRKVVKKTVTIWIATKLLEFTKISSFVPGSWAPNWLQGNARMVKWSSWPRMSYIFCNCV